MEILIYLHKILIQSSFHVFPLLTVRNLLLHRLRTVHPNHAAGPFDWAETGVFEVDLSIEMYNMKIVRFVILLVFMISYYVFYSIAAYIYISYTMILPHPQISNYVFKKYPNLGSTAHQMESHHQIASTQVVCLTGRQNLPGRSCFGKTNPLRRKNHRLCIPSRSIRICIQDSNNSFDTGQRSQVWSPM